MLPAHDILRAALSRSSHHHRAAPCRARRRYRHAVRQPRKPARRAAGEQISAETEIYIADTMGELGLFYRLAPFCFIGGTLVPLGGHNPLEPAVLHCAILAGPHRASAASAYEAILAAQGFGSVANQRAISRAQAARLLADPGLARARGRSGGARRGHPGRRGARAPSRCWKACQPCARLNSGSSAGAPALLLAPLGMLVWRSAWRWKARHAAPYRAKARVICVGNLTAGGSGKTPVAMAVAQSLIARGKNVFFLTRGYGGSEARTAAGDQPDARRKWATKRCCWRASRPPLWRATAPHGARLADASGARGHRDG